MKYPSLFFAKPASNQLCLFISLFLLMTCLLIFSAGAFAAAQNTRPRIIGDKSQSVGTKKARIQSKPLTGAEHRQAEERLAELGYWTGKIDGQWDVASRNALIAFQKVEGLKRTGQLTRSDFNTLMAARRPTPRETGDAHIEVDLVRQVLFIVDETGLVTKILPVSTGSGKEFRSEGWTRDAITHPGRYQVRSKIPGWKKSALGRLYYPVYFMHGTAIHGYPSVPTRPASHGCVRIPMFAAKQIFRSLPVGMPVIVHNDPPSTLANPAEREPR